MRGNPELSELAITQCLQLTAVRCMWSCIWPRRVSIKHLNTATTINGSNSIKNSHVIQIRLLLLIKQGLK